MKAARGKKDNLHARTKVRVTKVFSLEIKQAQRQFSGILKVLKEKQSHPRILYPVKISFKNEGRLKTF